MRTATNTSSSAIAERPRDTRVTLIRKIAKWNFLSHPFGRLRGNVAVSCVRRWKKRGRLPRGDNWTLTAAELRSGVFQPSFGDLGERQMLYLYPVEKRLIDFL